MLRPIININKTIDGISYLGNKIRSENKIDAVVCINKGGLLPGIGVSKILGCPLFSMKISRPLNLEKLFDESPRFLRPILELIYHIKFFTTKPEIVEPLSLDKIPQSVVIVDDAIETGLTINLAINHLESQGVKEIHTASLSYKSKAPPTYYWVKGRYCFPWSKHSPFKEEYKQLMGAKGPDNLWT